MCGWGDQLRAPPHIWELVIRHKWKLVGPAGTTTTSSERPPAGSRLIRSSPRFWRALVPAGGIIPAHYPVRSLLTTAGACPSPIQCARRAALRHTLYCPFFQQDYYTVPPDDWTAIGNVVHVMPGGPPRGPPPFPCFGAPPPPHPVAGALARWVVRHPLRQCRQCRPAMPTGVPATHPPLIWSRPSSTCLGALSLPHPRRRRDRRASSRATSAAAIVTLTRVSLPSTSVVRRVARRACARRASGLALTWPTVLITIVTSIMTHCRTFDECCAAGPGRASRRARAAISLVLGATATYVIARIGAELAHGLCSTGESAEWAEKSE